MNRQDYLDECYRQLNDPSFYKRVNEDPTEDINKRVRFYLKRLLADNIIDKQTHRYLTPENPKAVSFLYPAKNPQTWESWTTHRVSEWTSD